MRYLADTQGLCCLQNNYRRQIELILLIVVHPPRTRRQSTHQTGGSQRSADRGAVSASGELTLAITQLQRERLLRVVGVIKLPFNVRMLMIRAALLLMEEYIQSQVRACERAQVGVWLPMVFHNKGPIKQYLNIVLNRVIHDRIAEINGTV